jgi:hypothetical protein
MASGPTCGTRHRTSLLHCASTITCDPPAQGLDAGPTCSSATAWFTLCWTARGRHRDVDSQANALKVRRQHVISKRGHKLIEVTMRVLMLGKSSFSMADVDMLVVRMR